MSEAASSGVGAAGRVTLRPLETDASPDRPWLAEALAAVGGRDGRVMRTGEIRPAALLLDLSWPTNSIDIIYSDSEDVGFLGWRRDEAEASGRGGLVITALAVRADRRNLGYGAEAVAALEEHVGAAWAYAAVPRANGLAVYFWLHAGYRPVRVDEAPARALDPACLWMVRRLAG